MKFSDSKRFGTKLIIKKQMLVNLWLLNPENTVKLARFSK